MYIFKIHSSADGHVNCPRFLDNVDETTVSTNFWIYVCLISKFNMKVGELTIHVSNNPVTRIFQSFFFHFETLAFPAVENVTLPSVKLSHVDVTTSIICRVINHASSGTATVHLQE